MNTNISGAMSFYISGPPVPTVYAKSPPSSKRAPPRSNLDRDQALLSQIGRISSQRSPDATPAESIRSGRAGSIASSSYTTATGGSGGSYGIMSPTSSFSAGASSSTTVQHPGILAANTTFEYADEVLASLKFLMPFIKAGEVDSKAKDKAGVAFDQTDPFATGKKEDGQAGHVGVEAGGAHDATQSDSSSSATLTAMESEVYSILKTYVENKLKKKRGGKAKRLVEVGNKVEVLERVFTDCTTYTKLFKRVREAYDLPPPVDQTASATATITSTSSFGDSFGPIVTRESTPSIVSPSPMENDMMDDSFDRALPQFAPPRPMLDRSAVSNPSTTTTTTTSSGSAGPSSDAALTRQVSPTRSMSLGSRSGRRLSKSQNPLQHTNNSRINQHSTKPSYSSAESTSSSFLSNITAEDIFVNFGVGDVINRTQGSDGVGSSSAAVKSSRRPSMAILGSTFNFHSRKRSDGVNEHARENDDDDEFGWKGQKKRDEVEITWPIRDPLGSFAPNTADQHSAEVVKAKMAEALVDGIRAKIPVRPGRPAGSPLHALGLEDELTKEEISSTPKATIKMQRQPPVISDTFEADIFGTSPDRSPVEDRRGSGGSMQFDRSSRRGSVKSLGMSVPPPPSAPLPAIPSDALGDMSSPLARSRSNSSSSSAADHAKRQAVFLAATADPAEILCGSGEIEELQTRNPDDLSGSSFGIKSVDDAMAVLQGRLPSTPMSNGISEPGKMPPTSHKHSSWSRASASRLCDLIEEGEGEESDGDSGQAHCKRSLGLDDDMTSPALSANGQRYSTDSYDLKITTPEGHGSFHAEYAKKFDVGLGGGLDELDLEKELFFKAPVAAAKRDSHVLSSWS